MVPAGISEKMARRRVERSAGIVEQCYYHFIMHAAWMRGHGLERHRDNENQMPIRQGTIKGLRKEETESPELRTAIGP